MSTWSALNFQNASSPLMEQCIFSHNHVMMILILFITIVGYSLLETTLNKDMESKLLE